VRSNGRYNVLFLFFAVLLVSVFGCTTAPRKTPETEGYETLPGGGSIRIARWHDDMRAACSITFDDGTLDQYVVAAPELDRRNLKATFFLITEYRDNGCWYDSGQKRLLFSWSQARRLAKAGHEVGSHSRFHRDLSGNAPYVEEELAGSLLKISLEIPFARCVTFCWPYWRSSEAGRVTAAGYYISARGGTVTGSYLNTNGGVPSASPEDMYAVNACGALRRDSDELWHGIGREALKAGGWFVFNFHGMDDGSIRRDSLGWQPLPVERFGNVLDWLQSQDFWIGTFGSVSRYITERDNAVMDLKHYSYRSIVFSVEDGLDDRVYDQDLTVVMSLPRGWRSPRVYQGMRRLRYRTADGGGIVFDVRPNGRQVRLYGDS